MPPGVADFATFQYDVVDCALTQRVAGRKAGVAGADDGRGDFFDGGTARAPAFGYTTSTVTLVGLVTMS
jgi:hypothetical protein